MFRASSTTTSGRRGQSNYERKDSTKSDFYTMAGSKMDKRDVLKQGLQQKQNPEQQKEELITRPPKQVRADKIRAGNIKNHFHNWEEITSDKTIPDIIKHGLKINLKYTDLPSNMPFEHKLSVTESKVISEEIIKLLDKGVISKSVVTGNDFFLYLVCQT